MERCRHCGKPIEPFLVKGRWTHNDNEVYRKYCHDVKNNPKTWDINTVAEPFTKQEIINQILKEI